MTLVCCTFCSHGGRPPPMQTSYLSALMLPLVYLSGPLKMLGPLPPLSPICRGGTRDEELEASVALSTCETKQNHFNHFNSHHSLHM